MMRIYPKLISYTIRKRIEKNIIYYTKANNTLVSTILRKEIKVFWLMRQKFIVEVMYP